MAIQEEVEAKVLYSKDIGHNFVKLQYKHLEMLGVDQRFFALQIYPFRLTMTLIPRVVQFSFNIFSLYISWGGGFNGIR